MHACRWLRVSSNLCLRYSQSMCVCIQKYVHTYIDSYAYINTHTYTHTHYIYIYIYIYIYTHTHTYKSLYTRYSYRRIHAWRSRWESACGAFPDLVYMYMYMHMYTHTFYALICLCLYMHASDTCTQASVRMFAQLLLAWNEYVCILSRGHTHTHTHTHTFLHAITCICAHMLASESMRMQKHTLKYLHAYVSHYEATPNSSSLTTVVQVLPKGICIHTYKHLSRQ